MINALESWWRNFCNVHSSVSSPRLFLAVSGGMDSIALLHATAQWIMQRENNFLEQNTTAKYCKDKNFSDKALQHFPSPSVIQVIHINHGIHANSKQWAQHVDSLSRTYGFTCTVISVHIDASASFEAAARTARWDAFRTILKSNDVLWLAHHQRDQAETYLLRLMRGSGINGLGAMYKVRRDKDWFVGRPWLGIEYDLLKKYALNYQLKWVEDPSNNLIELDRNFIRHQILPLFESRWHKSTQRIALSTQLSQEAAEICQQQSHQDIDKVVDKIWAKRGIKVWQQNVFLELSVARQKNLLYYYLQSWKSTTDYFPNNTEKIWQQFHMNFMKAAADRQPKIVWSEGEIKRYRHLWFFIKETSNHIMHLIPQQLKVVKNAEKVHPLAVNWPHVFVEWQLKKIDSDITLKNNNASNEVAKLQNLVWGFSSKTTNFILDAQGQQSRYATFWQSRGIPPFLRNKWPVLFDERDLTTALFVPELYVHPNLSLNILRRWQASVVFTSFSP